MSELHNRGGARIGSGRPKTEETKMMRIPLSLVSAVECLKSGKPSSTEPAKDLQNKLTLALATIVGQQNRIDSLEDTIDTLRADNKALTSTVRSYKSRQELTDKVLTAAKKHKASDKAV
jgi:hypothetical protein